VRCPFLGITRPRILTILGVICARSCGLRLTTAQMLSIAQSRGKPAGSALSLTKTAGVSHDTPLGISRGFNASPFLRDSGDRPYGGAARLSVAAVRANLTAQCFSRAQVDGHVTKASGPRATGDAKAGTAGLMTYRTGLL
jgi:hypothetical protein